MSKLNLSGRYYRLFPPERFLGHAEEPLSLDTKSTAFLAVDVYGLGFAEEDEAAHAYPTMSLEASFEAEKEIVVNHVRPAMDAARRVGVPVIYVNNSAPRIGMNDSEMGKLASRSCDLEWDDWGSEDNVDPREYVFGASTAVKFSKIMEPQPDDYFIRKHAYSGFFQTRLDGLLRNLGIKTLICVGFALDMCLHCTMIDAMNLNYQVVLLRDCAMAVELPDEVEELSFTKRMIKWTEYAVGHSATSEDFIRACDAL
jgi:nicotinamidase-related amidase